MYFLGKKLKFFFYSSRHYFLSSKNHEEGGQQYFLSCSSIQRTQSYSRSIMLDRKSKLRDPHLKFFTICNKFIIDDDRDRNTNNISISQLILKDFWRSSLSCIHSGLSNQFFLQLLLISSGFFISRSIYSVQNKKAVEKYSWTK